MKVIIRDTAVAASEHIAGHIIHQINTFEPSESHPKYVLGLPTGSSPEKIYAALVAAHRAGHVSFANVITFKYVVRESIPTSYHDKIVRVVSKPVSPQSNRSRMLVGVGSFLCSTRVLLFLYFAQPVTPIGAVVDQLKYYFEYMSAPPF